MKLLKKLFVAFLFLTATFFSSCELLEDVSSGSYVHFHIDESSDVSVAKITVDGVTKSLYKAGNINACDGGDYIALATFYSTASTMNYVVKNFNGDELASGSVSLGEECIDFTFN